MQSGYIKLYRRALKNPVVCRDSDHVAVWLSLLLNAAHKAYSVSFRGKKFFLLPGQLITSSISISEKYRIDKNKVKRVLNLFESEQMITQESSNGGRIITIINWLKYQQPGDDREAQEAQED